ncbi:hypothetical protein HAP47_0023020 [Bradyrhizobium sp. 41S5]|uniref:hypothetical protein n=1 Tax=Bradyrhizobium sp. 41S5 TaxID=1404443 RepID=UPI00156A9CD2|nr:hypothetical protein [Bradyrhizobium sp. 41S5]UFX42135.1 hypothetical protein HAP47_0023020 [Bradyrhizobium sp. 41S5]
MTENPAYIVRITPAAFETETVNPWHGVAKIAERLGVKPIEAREQPGRPTVIVSGAVSVPLHGGACAPSYDLFELLEALLDRLDRVERGES